MKIIKVTFTDFWPNFNIYNNFIVEQLKKICIVEVVDIEKEPYRKSDVEYLFYSCFSKKFLEFDCIRVYYTGENSFPDFNLCDYAIGFEHMSVGDRYIRYPLCYADYRNVVRMVEGKKQVWNKKIDWNNRTKFCAMVVSNGTLADPKREQLFEEISEYMHIDSGGRYRNNIGMPDGVRDKISFMQAYSFGIAFENVSHSGYCTEKIMECFAARTIPIYWGDPLIGTYYNEKAFVNVADFKTKQELLAEIKRINENTKIKEEMMNEYPIKNGYDMENQDKKLCDFLNNIVNQEYELARRRSLCGWAWNYENELKVREAKIKELDSIKKSIDKCLYRRIIRKIGAINNSIVSLVKAYIH